MDEVEFVQFFENLRIHDYSMNPFCQKQDNSRMIILADKLSTITWWTDKMFEIGFSWYKIKKQKSCLQQTDFVRTKLGFFEGL